MITGGWDPQDEDSDLTPFTDAFVLNTGMPGVGCDGDDIAHALMRVCDAILRVISFLYDPHCVVKWEWTEVKSSGWVEGRVGHSSALLNANKRTIIAFGGQGIEDRFNDVHLLQVPETSAPPKRKRE